MSASLRGIWVTGCAALLLAGCGGGGSDSTTQVSARALARQGNLSASRSVATGSVAVVADEVATTAAATTIPAGKMVLGYYSGYSNNYSALTAYYSYVNAVAIDFWNITSAGAVVGNGDPTPSDAITFLKQKGIAIYGCISNVSNDGWDPVISHDVTSTNRSQAIANLVAFAKTNGFAGINIDFEAVDQTDRKNLSDFSTALATALHAQGLKLIMTVPAFSTVDENDPYNLPFDLAALGKSADYLHVMTYGEAIPGWDPGAVAGSDWMENALDYAVSKAPASKVLNGIPAYGYDWIKAGNGSQLFWRDVPALLSKYGVTPTYDSNVNAITFNYTKSGKKHTVWNENTRSVTLKTSLVNAYGLAGTSVYAFGMEDGSFWSAVSAGLQQ